MKAFKNWLILTFIFTISLASSCKRKQTPQPCDSNPCANLVGFDCVDGICKCPQGKYKVGDNCVALESYQYYGVGCTLFDTIILSVGAYNEQSDEVSIKYRTSNQRRLFPGYPKTGFESVPFRGRRYRDNNKSLDSLFFFVDEGTSYTIKDTISCMITAQGRFIENDKLRLKFYYRAIRQNLRLVDSCEMLLHK